MRALALALSLLVACSGDPADVSLLRSGTLHYTARSAGGAPLLAGQIEFTFSGDSTLSGTWSIGWLPGTDTTVTVGPQVGSGELVGRRNGDTLLIQLNPTNADHNVLLFAVVDGNGYSGRWEWSTIVGPQSAGTFSAARQ